MIQYIVDAFADQIFQGNPAAVCILDHWLNDIMLEQITLENALHETAFVVPVKDNLYHMRWLTQKGEINLCGHATLAAAHVITHYVTPGVNEVKFQTLGGELTVKVKGELLEMDFPAYQLKQLEVTDEISDALGVCPREVWRARDLVCVFDDPEDVLNMEPDQNKLLKLKGALMQVTAPGYGGYDCVSRTFSPKMGLVEDPVCGSGHCHIIPYWANRLGTSTLTARQASPRGGTLYCRMEGDRVILAGRTRLYAKMEVFLEGD